MAHYAIMRGEKRKTGDVRGITAHIARTQPTPNADPSKLHTNYAVIGPAWNDQKGINDAIEARTPAKYRKDAVRAIEYIVSASPEWFEQNSERQASLYFESAVDWFQDEFGAENVVSAVVHKDESSPHMHILVVPLDAETGRLNGKWFFGNKGILQKRQSRFAEHMSPFGVERGKADPERTHTKVSEWRAGHSKLDDREKHLASREASATARLQQAKQEAANAATAQAAARRASSELLLEQKKLDARTAEIEQKEEQVDQIINEFQADFDRQEEQLEEENARLSILRKEIEKRENTLKISEEALKERENAINTEEIALKEKIAEFEGKQKSWIASNEPPSVPMLVQKLRKMQHMSVTEARLFISANAEVGEYWNSMERRLSRDAYELLDRYSETAEKNDKWQQTFTASRNMPNL